MILGTNDDTVNPYNEETSKVFLLGSTSSRRVFNTRIAVINPIVKNQNKIYLIKQDSFLKINTSKHYHF